MEEQMKTTYPIRNRSSREIRLYLSEVAKIPLLAPEEEKELGRRAQNGDKDALQKLIESNLRFVIKVAKRYQKSGMPLLELINEGNIGLIEAANRFDPERGFRFTSYAIWWIRQSILRYLANSSHFFRVPPKLANILYRISTALAKSKELHAPNRAELAEEIGVSLKEIDASMEAAAFTYSLEQPLSEEGDLQFADKLEQTSIPSPETSVVNNDMKRQVGESLHSLSFMEQKILRLRFGLDDDAPRTLNEIGKKMSLSRERIRQIEIRALTKLRESSDFLAAYLN